MKERVTGAAVTSAARATIAEAEQTEGLSIGAPTAEAASGVTAIAETDSS